MHDTDEFFVSVIRYGRINDRTEKTFDDYDKALEMCRNMQRHYRGKGIKTALINLVTQEDSSPFDVDNKFAARNGISIEIIPGRMRGLVPLGRTSFSQAEYEYSAQHPLQSILLKVG